MNNEIIKLRRKKLLEKIEDNSVIIMFAGNAPKKTADEEYPFTPNRNFLYLTNVDEENHILVMVKNGESIDETLYIKDIDLENEKWVGKSLREDEAKELTGLTNIKFKSNFEADIHRIVTLKEEVNIYLDLERNSLDSEDSVAHKFAEKLRVKYPQVQIKNVFTKLGELRVIKSEDEIENMKKAIEITIEGLHSMYKNCKVGMKEYQLEAYFDFACKSNGVKDLAFKTIAASGKNATILHYVDNDDTLKDGDLIQFDLGAQYNYYNADISRVIPVNGKFTERQKEVYNAVLRVNEAIISEIKPGVKFVDINNMATDLIAEECIKLGLITDKKDVRKYYFHSIGHSLGLDTHDHETPMRNIIFEKGVVYTVEPGIYIEEESIGIRIEDDILITENGNENLTKNMVKKVDEIEKIMSLYTNNR